MVVRITIIAITSLPVVQAAGDRTLRRQIGQGRRITVLLPEAAEVQTIIHHQAGHLRQAALTVLRAGLHQAAAHTALRADHHQVREVLIVLRADRLPAVRIVHREAAAQEDRRIIYK